jgi:hypothetical protein
VKWGFDHQLGTPDNPFLISQSNQVVHCEVPPVVHRPSNPTIAQVPPACDVFQVEVNNLPKGSVGWQQNECSLLACEARHGVYPTPSDSYASVCGGGHNYPGYPGGTAIATQPPPSSPFGNLPSIPFGGSGQSVNTLVCRLAGRC